LSFRKIEKGDLVSGGEPVSAAAVQVFVYEGAPHGIKVNRDTIAVDYWRSGVVFDRATGKVRDRCTVAQGWPKRKPAAFAGAASAWDGYRLVGPGVVYGSDDKETGPVVAATARFAGQTWRALQPRRFLEDLGRHRPAGVSEKDFTGAWTAILQRLNELSYLEASGKPGEGPRRYTTKDGLAGNVVTHLVAADGSLWAACVDVYDPVKKAWGPGGLCRFDAKTARWQRIDKIDGRSVRWVTLLQTVGSELWVGFREGDGVEGDRVAYGMGLYPEQYRPKATALVLARLQGGKWTSFSRPLRPEAADPKAKAPPSTEVPRTLAVSRGHVFLYTTTAGRYSGNWSVDFTGHLSLLDPASKRWRHFDTIKDLQTDELRFLTGQDGEVLVGSNQGAHRWDAKRQAWDLLETGSPLRNPNLSAWALAGDELWVGTTNQSFGVTGAQGLSRFNERTGKWSYLSPKELGTGCPVASIQVVPRSGDVWVLFQPRAWGGAAVEYGFYPREARQPRPAGLGRFHAGKWQFPVKLDGVPETFAWEVDTPEGKKKLSAPAPVTALVVVGDRVYVACAAGVFEGPDKWKRILEGPTFRLETAEDGKALQVLRSEKAANKGETKFQQGTYDLQTGKWTFRDLPRERNLWALEATSGSLRKLGQEVKDRGGWIEVPTAEKARWAVGPLENIEAVLQTPRAVWLAGNGQLIRLDRAKLAGVLGKPGE
jgi:hypothetical protein